jgi:hypothetical protein
MPERFLASVLPQHETAELFRLMVTGIRECGVVLMDRDGVITPWNNDGPGDGTAPHYEILLRVSAGGAEQIGPASFLPAAER